MKILKTFFLFIFILALLPACADKPTVQPTLEPLKMPELQPTVGPGGEKGIMYWQKTLYTSPNPEKFNGEAVDFLGFVYRRPEDPKDVFFVGRLLLDCCYDDALPQGLPVFLAENEQWKDDQWVTVKGHWAQIQNGETLRSVIIPDQIKAADAPEDPYIYNH